MCSQHGMQHVYCILQTVVVTFSVNFNQVSMSSTKHPKSQKSKYVVLENV